MINSISYSRPKWDLRMVAALACVAVVLGIYPADRTVWCIEMVWAGAAFLGSQGDVWDAQKDILCDTLGAICSSGLYLCRERKSAK